MTESQYYYNKNKSLGLCVNSGTRKAAPNRVRYQECLTKKNERERKRKQAKRNREINKII